MMIHLMPINFMLCYAMLYAMLYYAEKDMLYKTSI